MFLLLTILWLLWMLKYILFWIYLWQLKEYHIGRFIDHFRTYKGKKILLNPEQIIKLVILLVLLANSSLLVSATYVLILLYLFQAGVFARNVFLKNLRKPVRTFKTIFLSFISFFVAGSFLFWVFSLANIAQVISLLAFDILLPAIVSVIVLFFQPFFVAVINNTLAKAKAKLDKTRQLSGLKVIAITGSYGKTSTKEFLNTILSKKFKVLSTKEHQNAEIGIANCILNDLKPSHQYFIAEVGAYNKGKVKEVCAMLKPKIGIVTGANEQHLSLFGSMENLLSAEGGGELAECLPNSGLLVVNGENKHCVDLFKKTNKPKKLYALSKNNVSADIWADEINVYKNYLSFVVLDRLGNMATIEAKVLGKQNVQNLLGAILVAKNLGMTFEEIADACKDISQSQAGMVFKHGKHGIDIIDSSYSANPDGVFVDLDYFKILPGKKVVVMPCLIELGKASSAIHQKIGKKIAEVCDLAIITSKDKFDDIKKGAMEAGMQEKDILFIENPHEIYSAVTAFCKSNDAVLLEGRVPAGLVKMLVE